MGDQFKLLFTPIDVGPMKLRNRIVVTPHATCFPQTGDSDAYYLAERAKGGAALVCTGAAIIDPEEAEVMPGHRPHDIDDTTIPWYQEIADKVHKYGAKYTAEFTIFGAVAISKKYITRPAYAPSVVSVDRYKNVPIELDSEGIQRVVKLFTEAAIRAQKGGVDGIEILAGHGHLLSAFLSPFANRRTDEFGGPVENRARLSLMVLESIRKAVGPGVAIGIRISADEYQEGGINTDVAKENAAYLAHSGLVDWLDICHGHSGYYFARSFQPPPMYLPLGMHAAQTAVIRDAIKEVADIPVLSGGAISDPILAEKILADGHADLVGMTRACIADPDMPNKAKSGQLDDIRQCCRCLEGCGRCWELKPILCTQNTAVSREREWTELRPAAIRKKIMVIGGGPAGLETARVAALRGHEVTLYEKNDELGGQVNIASKAPGREEFAGIARWLAREVSKVADVQLNTEITADAIIRENPDAVVIATGSVPCRPSIPGATDENLVDIRSLLAGKAKVGQKTIVLDETGHMAACSAADFLAEQGKEVYILNNGYMVADFIDDITRPIIYGRLQSKGVVFMPLTWIRSISDRTVTIYNTCSLQETKIEGVDTLIYTQSMAANSLYHSIKGKIKELHVVGDALTPRLVIHATYEGSKLGREL